MMSAAAESIEDRLDVVFRVTLNHEMEHFLVMFLQYFIMVGIHLDSNCSCELPEYIPTPSCVPKRPKTRAYINESEHALCSKHIV